MPTSCFLFLFTPCLPSQFSRYLLFLLFLQCFYPLSIVLGHQQTSWKFPQERLSIEWHQYYSFTDFLYMDFCHCVGNESITPCHQISHFQDRHTRSWRLDTFPQYILGYGWDDRSNAYGWVNGRTACCNRDSVFTFNNPTSRVTGSASKSTATPELSWSRTALRFLLLHAVRKTPSVSGPFLHNSTRRSWMDTDGDYYHKKKSYRFLSVYCCALVFMLFKTPSIILSNGLGGFATLIFSRCLTWRVDVNTRYATAEDTTVRLSDWIFPID